MEKEDFIKRFNEIQENSNKKIIVFINRCSKVNLNYQMNYINNVNSNKKEGDYQTVFGKDDLTEYRKNRVGGKMMESLIKLSKKRGKKGIVLTCKEYFIYFYKKFGYKNMVKSKSVHGGTV